GAAGAVDSAGAAQIGGAAVSSMLADARTALERALAWLSGGPGADDASRVPPAGAGGAAEGLVAQLDSLLSADPGGRMADGWARGARALLALEAGGAEPRGAVAGGGLGGGEDASAAAAGAAVELGCHEASYPSDLSRALEALTQRLLHPECMQQAVSDFRRSSRARLSARRALRRAALALHGA
ncbi:hypothetical protein MNEG_9564, partial [Monoraphidium neglectum]